MSFILIDRRKAGRGKSSSNRQKLIKRVKSFIKSSSPQNIGKFGGVTGQSSTAPSGGGTSPVKVAGTALEEPYFAYARDGQHTQVFIGNNEYERGDEIEIPSEDGGGSGKGGPGENGEDEFIINVARNEFLDLFFEDCELPNLTNEKWTEKLDNQFQQAGFSTTGSPAQLSIVRSYKQSLGRRKAMSGPHQKEKEELLEELAVIYKTLTKSSADHSLEVLIKNFKLHATMDEATQARVDWIINRLNELKKKLQFIKGFDKSDLRYRKKEAKPLKTVDAVLFMLMDISGSMDETKKTIARRWFALFYAFIQRRYPNTELVFIAHTDEPFEMSEDDFFSTRINGGTTVSPALKMINTIIRERYDPNEVNIYISHASDGDNWDDDNPNVVDEMIGDGRLMAKIQLFSYVEVGKNVGGLGWFNIGQPNPASGPREDSGLWKAYDEVRQKVNEKKVTLSVIETAEECYPIFKKVFKKSK